MTLKKYKNYCCLIIVVATFVSCSKVTDWHKFGVKSKVKTYNEKYYKPLLKNGKWEKGEIAFLGHNNVSFDKDGNYVLIEYMSDNDELSGKVIPKRVDGYVTEENFYLENGTLINSIQLKRVSDRKQEFVVINNKGKKTSEGKMLSKNDRIIKQKYKTFEEDVFGGEKEYLVSFEYDENGNMVSRQLQDSKGAVDYFYRYEYVDFDDNNNWTKRLDFKSQESKKPENVVIREYIYY
jgi:hypothetical protein